MGVGHAAASGTRLGPLPPGDYRIAATIHQYREATGSLDLLCAAREPAAFRVFAQPGPVDFGLVVEYHHAGLDQYFITQDTREQALLDAGGAWQRAGQTFAACLPGGSDGRGFPVMREYDTSPAGIGAHFFSYGEWPLVYRPEWITETGNAFEIEVPSWPAETCRAGSMVVYRPWNARRGSGHRYVADAGAKAAMAAQGWVAEGTGRIRCTCVRRCRNDARVGPRGVAARGIPASRRSTRVAHGLHCVRYELSRSTFSAFEMTFRSSLCHNELHVTHWRPSMASVTAPKPSRVKVSEHRARLRAQGLRPIQIWVPDMRAPSFRTEAHRQSLAVAASARAGDDQAFIDAVSDRGDE